MSAMEKLKQRIVAWADRTSDVRAVIVIGSRARVNDRPADEYSDLDLLLLADHPARYIHSEEWLDAIGTPVVTFLEGAISGSKERRVLFADALDVDFNFLPANQWRWLNRYMRLKSQSPFLTKLVPAKLRREIETGIAVLGSVVKRGYSVLLDKEGLTQQIPKIPPHRRMNLVPSEPEARNAIGDFWYHALWTAKKLRRGELLVAKHGVDGYLKMRLYRAAEILAVATYGPEYDTWHDLRFFEQWADPTTVANLPRLYAHYDEGEMNRALLATMSVYGRVTRDAFSRLGYQYPQAMEDEVTRLVRECLDRR
ncbi:MAG TPA: aminoglycoside 6-adenylyltransferase [Symbiobacteriaceae bacterium]|nr:aminoglycoside 6-adenylyltransferase [Symbiobacteriaceae bacterium]